MLANIYLQTHAGPKISRVLWAVPMRTFLCHSEEGAGVCVCTLCGPQGSREGVFVHVRVRACVYVCVHVLVCVSSLSLFAVLNDCDLLCVCVCV